MADTPSNHRGSATSRQNGSTVNGRSPSDVYAIITERICALLTAGTVPWRQTWKHDGGAPCNLISRKPYRGINAFLLSCTPFASPYWVTFRQAKQLGGSVKKGVKGYPVIFWRWIDAQGDNAQSSEEGMAKSHHHQIPLLRYYTVFNAAEQCEGLDVPPLPARDSSFDPIAACTKVIEEMPNRPRIEHNAGGLFYQPATDTVFVPQSALFVSSAEYYCGVFHELGHATGHVTRLARPGITDPTAFASHAYSREELIAEMTSAFLAGHCGIEAMTIDNSAAYIAAWLRELRNDRRLVVMAAAQAQKAADYILGRQAEERGDERPVE